MDDIYFSDKRNRRSNDDGYSPKERFTESNRYDMLENPSLRKRSPYTDERDVFSVTPSDDDGFDIYRSTPVSRTPRGERLAPPPSRTPTGARVGADTDEDYIPPQRTAPERKPVPERSRSPYTSPVNPSDKPKGAITKGKIAAAIGGVLLLFLLGIFVYGYIAMGSIDYDDSITKNPYIDEKDLMHSSRVKNILIMGSDGREDVSGERADTMILFTIDKKNKQLKLTSFLRDSYIYIPEFGYEDKLNAAYSAGGAQLTMDTIEYNFGIKIDSYITINFEVFKQFIDLLGGIPVELAEYEAEYMVNECKYPRAKPGLNNFNGAYALMYCRMRYLDDDFHRTQRQRKVIKTVVAEVAKTNLFKLMGIVKDVAPNIKTDCTRNQLIALGAGAALKFLRYDIVQQQIPANGTWWDDSVNGASVIDFDLDENREILEKFIFEKHVEKTTDE
ncbi:MAG: LCP family protein [Clostridia bacterium]|nr:LCP family protein [Clostridia bacterium]